MTPERWSDWLSVEDAAEALGVSVSTLKRRMREGKPVTRPDGSSVEVQGEQIQRPQGPVWRVRVPADLAPVVTDQAAADSKKPPAVSSDQVDDRVTDQAAITTLREMIALERAERHRVANENTALRGELRDEAIARAVAEADARHERARAADLQRRLDRAEWRWWHRWTRGEKPPA